MPRLANDGAAVAEWYKDAGGNGSSTWDFCRDCADCWEESLAGLTPYNGDPKGDELTDGGCAPCYETEYEEGNEYPCAVCGVVLRECDN